MHTCPSRAVTTPVTHTHAATSMTAATLQSTTSSSSRCPPRAAPRCLHVRARALVFVCLSVVCEYTDARTHRHTHTHTHTGGGYAGHSRGRRDLRRLWQVPACYVFGCVARRQSSCCWIGVPALLLAHTYPRISLSRLTMCAVPHCPLLLGFSISTPTREFPCRHTRRHTGRGTHRHTKVTGFTACRDQGSVQRAGMCRWCRPTG